MINLDIQRLISYIPPFVAQAAMDTGVARRPIEDMDAYRASLAQRLDPDRRLHPEDLRRGAEPRPRSASSSPRARSPA